MVGQHSHDEQGPFDALFFRKFFLNLGAPPDYARAGQFRLMLPGHLLNHGVELKVFVIR